MAPLSSVVKHVEGLDSDVVDKLKRAGVSSAEDLALANLHVLSRQSGVPEKLLGDAVRAILLLFAAKPIRGEVLAKRLRRRTVWVPTGIPQIDQNLLRGGVLTGEITEIAGPSCTGKTQFALTASLQTIFCDSDPTVLYIDTHGTFSASRLEEMIRMYCIQRNMRSDEEFLGSIVPFVAGKLRVISATSHEEVIAALRDAERSLARATDRFWSLLRMVIVDSIWSVYDPIVTCPGINGSAYLSETLLSLKALATENDLVVLVTNAAFGQRNSCPQPAMVDIMRPFVSTTILLQYALEQQRRSAVVLHSRRHLPGDTCEFRITAAGIQ